MIIDLPKIIETLQDKNLSKIRKKWKIVSLIPNISPSTALELVEKFGINKQYTEN